MNNSNTELLQTINKLCFWSASNFEKAEKMTKNSQFLSEIIKQSQEFDIIFKESEMLAKAMDITLKKSSKNERIWSKIFAEKPNLISVRVISTILYLQIVNTIPELIFSLNDNENASTEVVELGQKLKVTMEQNEKNLKQYFNFKQTMSNEPEQTL